MADAHIAGIMEHIEEAESFWRLGLRDAAWDYSWTKNGHYGCGE